MLCGLVEPAYDFNTIAQWGSSFANCTQQEEKITKCINGVCLSRTDTIQRQAFCLCLIGFDGLRCETSDIPQISETTIYRDGNTFPYELICIVTFCIFLCLVLILIYWLCWYKTQIQRVSQGYVES